MSVTVGKIGYKNLFTTTGVTVTVSSEAVGYEKENAYDWLGFDWWKPTATGNEWIRVTFATAQAVDYFAVWGHDLADHGSSIYLQYSNDGGAFWYPAGTTATPTDNNTIFQSFTSISAKDWRIQVQNPTTIAAIAGLMIGESLDMPRNVEIGYEVSSLAPIVKLKTARSESGVFLGGSKQSEGVEGAIKATSLAPAWVRSDWVPFLQHAQTPKPFVWSWDSSDHADEAVLAWAKGQPETPKYSDSNYMDVSIEYEGTL